MLPPMTTSLLPHLKLVSLDDSVTSFLLVSCMFRKLDCVSTPDLNCTLFLSHVISKQWPDQFAMVIFLPDQNNVF